MDDHHLEIRMDMVDSNYVDSRVERGYSILWSVLLVLRLLLHCNWTLKLLIIIRCHHYYPRPLNGTAF